MDTRRKELLNLVMEKKQEGSPVEDAVFLISTFESPLNDSEIAWIKEIYPTVGAGPSDEIPVQIAKAATLERMKKELSFRDITRKYEALKIGDAKVEKLSKLNFLQATQEQVREVKKRNRDAFKAFRDSKPFIGPMFNGIVPYSDKEVILLMGETGGAKTSVLANVAWATIKQVKNESGRYGKVLVISNEETETDLLNRMACLKKLEEPGNDSVDWYYVAREKFTDEQLEYFEQFIDEFKGNGHINIVGLNFGGESEFTTYIENVKAILNQVAQNPGCVDAVFLDYYQCVSKSLSNPLLNEWMVQREFAQCLNSYKDILGCPLVIFAQANPPTKDRPCTAYKDRIVGTKAIAQPCTFIMEVVAKKDTLTTEWILHKARYSSSTSGKVVTGFKYGRVVSKDAAFDTWALPKIQAKEEYKSKKTSHITRQERVLLKLVGPPKKEKVKEHDNPTSKPEPV